MIDETGTIQTEHHHIDTQRGHIQVYLEDGTTYTITDLGGSLAIPATFLGYEDARHVYQAIACWCLRQGRKRDGYEQEAGA